MASRCKESGCAVCSVIHEEEKNSKKKFYGLRLKILRTITTGTTTKKQRKHLEALTVLEGQVGLCPCTDVACSGLHPPFDMAMPAMLPRTGASPIVSVPGPAPPSSSSSSSSSAPPPPPKQSPPQSPPRSSPPVSSPQTPPSPESPFHEFLMTDLCERNPAHLYGIPLDGYTEEQRDHLQELRDISGASVKAYLDACRLLRPQEGPQEG